VLAGKVMMNDEGSSVASIVLTFSWRCLTNSSKQNKDEGDVYLKTGVLA
jgi:hypothetical protein